MVIVCQLHGGDIGVSSKEGEGSTFGFFFKVRQSDGSSSEDGRPPFSSRSNSENPSTPKQRGQTPRPADRRNNSNLQEVRERTNEREGDEVKVTTGDQGSGGQSNKSEAKNGEKRPEMNTLTSHSGVNVEDIDPSLKNPPTEYFAEAHPEAKEDERYRETASVANEVTPPVEGHDGRLQYAESGESARQYASANKAHESQKDRRSEDKRTLLLVEDNLINQKVLRRQLQARGFEVFVANNGQEAIDAVSERGKTAADDQYNRNYFDCILMDQEMPIKDGNQATLEIRQLQDEGKAGYSKILGVSANVRQAQRDSMREAGMDDLISKPFKVDALVKKIDELTIGGEDGNGADGQLAAEATKQKDPGEVKDSEMTTHEQKEQEKQEKEEDGKKETQEEKDRKGIKEGLGKKG